MGGLVVLYAIPVYKVYVRKTSPEMTPRSPHMIIMYLCYLMLDSIVNTYLFAINPGSKTVLVCYLGVFCTVICQFGIMLMVFLRMYRIYSVFSSYEEYLKWQKLNILNDVNGQPTRLRQTATDSPKFKHLSPKSNQSVHSTGNLRVSTNAKLEED